MFRLLLGGFFPWPACMIAVMVPCIHIPDVIAKPVFEFLDTASVDDTLIRLGDIARISGMNNPRDAQRVAQIPVGEAAPASYARFVGFDEVLHAAARHGFPLSIAADKIHNRILVKTGYQEKNIRGFEHDIKAYIRENVGWTADDYTVAILNPLDHIACLKTPVSVKIEGLPSKYPKGNFLIKILLMQGSRRYTVHAQCSMSVVTSVVVAGAVIPKNTPCDETNCVLEKRDITHFKFMPYAKLSDVRRKTACRTVSPGSILHEKMLVQTPDVQRDQQVQVIVAGRCVTVSMTARAREDGTIGKQIWVENEVSHKLLRATIIASGKAVLSQGEKTL